MNKNILLIIVIVLMFIVMYEINRNAPIKFRWNPTYETDDKQPYGAFALDRLLEASWKEGYIHSYKNIADLYADGDLEDKNLLIVCSYFKLLESQKDVLIEYVEAGGNVFVAASDFEYTLCDSLNFYAHGNFSPFSIDLSLEQTTTAVYFHSSFDKDSIRNIPKTMIDRSFYPEERDSIGENGVFVMAANSDNEAIMLRYELGSGNLIVCSTPTLFTNYAILNDSINPFIGNALAPLIGKPLIRTEYYEKGMDTGESDSPFRYLLSQPPLKWAFYIVLGSLLLFMLFTIKRKQKIIPVIKPPENKMLDFVRSISTLYLNKNNNADIVLKKQMYWGDELRKKYGVDIINEQHDQSFIKYFSTKTGMPEKEARNLFLELDAIREHSDVSDKEMMNLITKMKID